MPPLELFLFGPPRLQRDGKLVKIARRKATALLAYLAISGGRHSRDGLATLFWPDSSQADARTDLRKVIWVLRDVLEEALLEVGQEYLALGRSDDFWLDVDHFQAQLARCRTHNHLEGDDCVTCLDALTAAVGWYGDGFMAGFSLRDSLGFDAWQSCQNELFHHEQSWALNRLACAYNKQGKFDQAVFCAQRWLALDPLNETAHYRMMQIYAQAGQRSAALQQYRRCVQILDQELGVGPPEEITRLYRCLNERPENLLVTMASLPTPRRSHNLLHQPTRFVGRENELAQASNLLHNPDCRLVTLTGMGGVGKTRLALQVALQAANADDDAFPHGVYFVSLAPLPEPDFMIPAIADALQLSFHGNMPPLAQLLNYLSGKAILLVLDNFEHLIAGASLLAEILGQAPNIKLLVTSRQRLNLRWEWPFEIYGLDIPEEKHLAPLESYSSVALFIQSASRVASSFALAIDGGASVARICRALDGLPLGIELAAAWVETFSCQEIAHQIERNLDLLTAGFQDAPERHHSLRAAFAHSWKLLSDDEKQVFRRVSVFRGGFDPDAAVAVAGASAPTLQSLLHKSLLHRNVDGRYGVIEILRQYAQEKLDALPVENDEVRRRHGEFYTEFFYCREKLLCGANQRAITSEIKLEYDNFLAAWQWAITAQNDDAIARSMLCLYSFCEIQRLQAEAEKAFLQAEAMLRDLVTDPNQCSTKRLKTLGRLLALHGGLCQNRTNFDRARVLLEESLSILERLGERHAMAFPLDCLGLTLGKLSCSDAVRNDPALAEQARHFCLESLAISREFDDREGIGNALNSLGHMSFFLFRDHEAARQLQQEALAVFGELGHRNAMIACLEGLCYIALALEEYDGAKIYAQQSLVLMDEIDDRGQKSGMLAMLGRAYEGLGDYPSARAVHQDGLALAQEYGEQSAALQSLIELGFVSVALQIYLQASEYFYAAWEYATRMRATPLILRICAGMAAVLAKQAQETVKVRAVELAEFVREHPNTWPQERVRAGHVLTVLAHELSIADFTTAQAAGRAKLSIGVSAIADNVEWLGFQLVSEQSDPDLLRSYECGINWAKSNGLLRFGPHPTTPGVVPGCS